MKPKSNRKSDEHKASNINTCQTPDYALDPLLPYLPKHWTIWEPAAGQGFLARAMLKSGIHKVVTSDILDGRDFITYKPDEHIDAIVTNPPYNPAAIKPAWARRCHELGIPWANLWPLEVIGSGEVQEVFAQCGVEIIYLNKRVNFKMPYKGWGGSAQFPVAWFTSALNIGRQITFAKIYRRNQDQIPLFEYADNQPSLFG